MKKMFLVLMLVVLSSFSFAARGDRSETADFYFLYSSAYEASGNPDMHEKMGIESTNVEQIKAIINKGWYEMKLLEADKLKEVFTIDMLLVEGPGNQKKIEKHLKKIAKISEKMDKIRDDSKAKLSKLMDVSDL